MPRSGKKAKVPQGVFAPPTENRSIGMDSVENTDKKDTDTNTTNDEKLGLEDLRVLQLLYTNFENTKLKLQNLELQIEITKQNALNAQRQLQEANAAANRKYNLNTEKDKIDINTGVISRG